MASKVSSPWDSAAQQIAFEFVIDDEVHQYLVPELIEVFEHIYRYAYAAGAKSEREFPHREDMGR